MRLTPTATALAALATALATPATAQDAFAIDEIVVSANLGETEASRTGTSVTVLDAEDIAKTGETRLTDILARLPGVGVLARGPLGTQTGLTIRGVGQNYIKVLIDGIDVADPSGPQVAYDFGRLTSFGLDRVEVLRGSQSAVYGTQAIGGVISLGTALPEDEGVTQEAAVEAGSYNTLSGRYGYGIRRGGSALGFTLSHVTTDGYSAANEADGNTEADGYEATRLSVRGETMLGDGVTLGFAAFIEDSKADYDPRFYADPTRNFSISLGDGESSDEQTDALSRGLRLSAGFKAGATRHNLSFGYFDIERVSTGSEVFLDYDNNWNVIGATLRASREEYTGRRTTVAWNATRSLGPGELTYGLDSTRETYGQQADYGYGGPPSINGGASRTSGAFVEWSGSLGEQLDLTANLRIDEHSVFGTFSTGRAAVAYRVTPDTILRASAGSGFRAPSGYELFGPYGDASLEPEESTSFDLGLEQWFGASGFVRATLFRIETENLIDYSSNYFQTTGKTVRQGLEFEGGAEVSDHLRVTGAYTLTDSENPSGLSVGNTWNSGFGRHQLALGVDADLSDRLTASLGLLHVADRPTLPDYTLANATFTYDLGNASEAYLRLENLTDEDYELVDGYGTSGRAVYVGLRTRF